MADVRIGEPRNYDGGSGSTGVTPMRASPSRGSPSVPGPRDIMRARYERDARRKEELERVQQEDVQPQQRITADTERYDSTAGQRVSVPRNTTMDMHGVVSSSNNSAPDAVLRNISDNAQSETRNRTSAGAVPRSTRVTADPASGRGTSSTAQPTRPSRPQVSPGMSQNIPQGDGGIGAEGPSINAARSRATSSKAFPLAFERWETLSAHWEGLTSFWLRRIDASRNEIDRDPISQQLSRQVSDLSAAGANLFHAVVELQRLRASSERKFQRWFADTRDEQEKSREITKALEAQLQQERSSRVQAHDQHVQLDSSVEVAELKKQIAEARRELTISRDESRRAWEELGRREQDERERLESLRQGQPTVVNGVTVVPVIGDVPARRSSVSENPQAREEAYASERPQARGGPYPGGPGPTVLGEQETLPNPDQAYSRGFTGNVQNPYFTTQPPSAPTYLPSQQLPAGYYQQSAGTQQTQSSGRPQYLPQAYVVNPSSTEGRHNLQSQAYHEGGATGDHDSDDYEDFDATADRAREVAGRQSYGLTPSDPALDVAQQRQETVDYPVESYDTGWESVPRHQHPTLLSVVMEEDERSRTSASQISRRDSQMSRRD